MAFFGEQEPPPAIDHLGSADLGPLQPGTYQPRDFQPALVFTLGSGWHLRQYSPTEFTLTRSVGAEHLGPALKIRNLEGGHVAVDPADGLRLEEPESFAPLPLDLGAWFEALPYLDTAGPKSVELDGPGGATTAGTTMAFTALDLPTRPGCIFNTDCLNALSFDNDERSSGFLEGDAGRLWVFETVPGPLYVVAYGLVAPGLLEFLRFAGEVVDSVRFP